MPGIIRDHFAADAAAGIPSPSPWIFFSSRRLDLFQRAHPFFWPQPPIASPPNRTTIHVNYPQVSVYIAQRNPLLF
jgi:hypothetical protein